MSDPDIRQSFDPRGRRSFLIMLTLLMVIVGGAFTWQIKSIIDTRSRVVGDGRHVETYDYDLSNFTGKRDLLAAYMSKDGQLAMVDPGLADMSIVDAQAQQRFIHSRAIVSDDLVVGVSINGESRAYPIHILNWHEIVNDTLGGVPIAVTYSPISRGVVVFDRRVEKKGDGSPYFHETLEFGYSGLFYNHHLLMYDRYPRKEDVKTGSDPILTSGESLWSQMLFEAVSGPMAGMKLTVLPCELTRWKHWRAVHPDTSLIAGDPLYVSMKRYKRSPYSDRASHGLVVFPVEPLAPGTDPEGFNRFDFIRAVKDGDVWRVALHRGDEVGDFTTPVVYAMWFVWNAAHPDDGVVEPREPSQ